MPIREQPTSNKQHAIPQSIMSVEFKIIGDLTIKQFFFLMLFCGLAYVCFMTIQVFIIKWLLISFFVLTGLAFAFMPLGDRGLDMWVVNFLRAMFLPNQFVYRKQEDIPNVFLYQNLDVLKSELITLTPTSSRRKIEAYLEQQVAPEDKLDIDEKSFILKVKEAYSGYNGYTPNTGGMSTASIDTSVQTVAQPVIQQPSSQPEPPLTIQPEVQPSYPATPQPSAQPTVPGAEALHGYSAPAPIQPVPEITPQFNVPATEIKQVAPQTLPVKTETPKIQPETIQSTIKAVPPLPVREGSATPIIKSPGPVNIPKPPARPMQEESPIIKSRMPYKKKKSERSSGQNGYYSPSMTPDMHSGRRFINLSQEAARGEIILPIRGEKVIGSESEKKFDNDEARKVKELDSLITQIKSKELIQRQIIEAQKIQESEEERRKRLKEAEERARAKTEAASLAERKKQLEDAQRAQEKALQEEQSRKAAAELEARKLREKEESLRKQKEELLKKQRDEEQARQKKIESEGVKLPPRPQAQAIPLQPADTKDSPDTPNIIWGVVTTIYENNKVPVPGVVVVFRNQKKEVVRAIKSNAQGKFGITTPLLNGSYTLEVDKEKKSGLNFPVTSVEAAGKIIPVLEIAGTV